MKYFQHVLIDYCKYKVIKGDVGIERKQLRKVHYSVTVMAGSLASVQLKVIKIVHLRCDRP